MNLIYANELMVAAGQQGDRNLSVTGSRGCRQGGLMADAGLLEMSHQGATQVSIDRLTDLGRTFPRTFAVGPGLPAASDEASPDESPTDSGSAVVTKWQARFAEMQKKFVR